MPISAEVKHCFVLMPFREDLRRVHERVFKPVCKANGVRCWRVDEESQPGTITNDIIKGIIESDIIIADITDHNANVFYELGVAHAIGNKTILVAQSFDSVPFDISVHRMIRYRNTQAGLQKLTIDLDRAVKSVLANAAGTNPVHELILAGRHSLVLERTVSATRRRYQIQKTNEVNLKPAKRTVAGTWKGLAVDAEIPGFLRYKRVLQYKVICKLRHRGKQITGNVHVVADVEYGLIFTGRFEDSKYIFAEYQNSNPNTTDRGYAILELSGNGDELSGILIGRGMREPTVAVVSVKLARVH